MKYQLFRSYLVTLVFATGYLVSLVSSRLDHKRDGLVVIRAPPDGPDPPGLSREWWMQVFNSNTKRLKEAETEHKRYTKLMKEARSPEAWKEVREFNRIYGDWFKRENDRIKSWSLRSPIDMILPMDRSIEFFRDRIAFLEERRRQFLGRIYINGEKGLWDSWDKALKRCTQGIKEAESLIQAVRFWSMSKPPPPSSPDHKSTSETQPLLQGHGDSPSHVSKLSLLSIRHC